MLSRNGNCKLSNFLLFLSYLVGDTILEFFNSLLKSALPQKVSEPITKFLCINTVDPSSSLVATHISNSFELCDENLAFERTSKYDQLYDTLSKISRSASISVALMSSIDKNEELQSDSCSRKKDSNEIDHGYVPLNSSNSNTLSALSKVMTERDESHAQIVASSVLHVHDIELERKKVDRLTKKLILSKRQLFEIEATANASYFQTNDNALAALKKKFEKEKNQLENSFLENNDAELMSLCRQLASEIESRTAATLEINRNKELHEHEKVLLKDENSDLRAQLEKLRQELDNEREKARKFQEGENLWKKAFKDLSSSTQSFVE